MSYIRKTLFSSLIKKFVMAITGLVLVSFLLMHMLGNLQTLEGGPHAINAYANFLQTLPWEFLWGFRAVIALCIVLHLLMGYLLVLENRKARPQGYSVKRYIKASWAARTMIYTGSIVVLFALLHVLHFTMLYLDPVSKSLEWVADSGMYEGKTIHDVYAMMIYGFNIDWVAILYIVAMLAIAIHLTHAFSSMFQTLGLRNEKWRNILSYVAILYAVVIFFGFSINPIAVLISKYTPLEIFPVKAVCEQIEAKKCEGKDIFVDYAAIEAACSKGCDKNNNSH